MNDTSLSTSSHTTVRTKSEEAVRAALRGRSRGWRALLPFVGPAFIASIAYVDPGNFATNIQGGSQFGYSLLWVIVAANIIAMLMQNLSAKLGIATGRNLPELCRQHFPAPITYLMWAISEIAAMATDIAEFLGATLALNLLFGIPMLLAAALTGIITYLILMMERWGFRPLERFVAAFAIFIALCYLVETVFSKPSFGQIVYHSVVPWLGSTDSILLAVGVIGATVMPHAIYLHSGLTQNRVRPNNRREALRIHKYSTIEIGIAMGIAGFVNLSMMYMAAAVFHSTGHEAIADITNAYRTLTPLLGPAAAGFFLASLLASGVSSSVVGTMAGQVIMQGFVGFTIPMWVRRVVTMLPTFILVALGVNPMRTLVISQVVLSLALPIPILALIYFTRRKAIMGILVNKRWITAAACVCAGVILVLNLWLVLQSVADL